MKILTTIILALGLCMSATAQSITQYQYQADSTGSKYVIIRTTQTKTADGVDVNQNATEWLPKDAAIQALIELKKQITNQSAQVDAIMEQILKPAAAVKPK